MNSCAIICEYNPLHKGHIFHISNTLENLKPDVLIAIISGNFTQRGSLSIIDRYAKAHYCLKNGFDLVLELPSQFATSSAENFAFGAISLIKNLLIDHVSFGSECGEIEPLLKIAEILTDEPLEFKTYLRLFLDEGLPYHLCRKNALSKYIEANNLKINLDILNTSNNILSIEYLKNLLRTNSKAKPYTIKRETSYYSSSTIRNHLNLDKNLDELEKNIPTDSFKALHHFYKKYDYFISDELIFPYLKYKLLTLSNKLNDLPDCTEGMHNKIPDSVLKSDSLDSSLHLSKSKRYTYTRLSRIALQYFIGFEYFPIKEMLKKEVREAKILGFNDKGKYFLNKKKKECDVNLYDSINKNENSTQKLLSVLCTKAYSLINKDVDPIEDYLKHPIIF